MSLPDEVRKAVERALQGRGLRGSVSESRSVGGGCINNGARILTDSGISLFLKWNANAPTGMFAAEAEGLRALRTGGVLRVPEPLDLGEDGGIAWLLMEFVPSGAPDPAVQAALGRGLAELHAAPAGQDFGWERDNWIGSLDQANEVDRSWAAFWRERRIAPQLELARGRGRARETVFDDLLEAIPEALSDVERPELVHGDLWAGNWFASRSGEPVVIDPAVYRGHGEVDLAMSELFGGFGPAFYDAYRDTHGISEAYDAYRRDLYQLYYLLVHVNLFGGAYESGSRQTARRALAELR